MTGREMQIAVERMLRSVSKSFATENKINSDTIFYYLTKGQLKLVEEYEAVGVERNSSIKTNLGSLFQESSIDVSATTATTMYNGIVTPSIFGLRSLLSEHIIDSNDNEVPVKSISHNYYNSNKNNPFKLPEEKVLCWRIILDSNYVLIYPGEISKYCYSYLDSLRDISLDSSSLLNSSVHDKIVDIAFAMIIEKYSANSTDNNNKN